MAQAYIKLELENGEVKINMAGMTGELADLLIEGLGTVIAGCSPELRGELIEKVTEAIHKAVKKTLDDKRPGHGAPRPINDEAMKQMAFGAFMKALFGTSGGPYNL